MPMQQRCKLSEPVNGDQVFHAELLYPAEQQENQFKTIEAFEEHMPASLGVSSALFWNATTNSVSFSSLVLLYVLTSLAKTRLLSTFIPIRRH